MKGIVKLCFVFLILMLVVPTSHLLADEQGNSSLHFSLLFEQENAELDLHVVEDRREEAGTDSLIFNKNFKVADSLFNSAKDGFKLNEDAVKSIRFDFSPSPKENSNFKKAPIDKPWMNFQVDLSVPKSMIDTAKVRKPEKYIRMLPYTIWTLYGENPVYDALVFGNKKFFEIMWKLNLEDAGEFGRNALPNAGSYNPNSVGSSVVIGNLDFIGFLYNNLNKQGRIRKHNRKHANAWKTYQSVAPVLADSEPASTELIVEQNEKGLYHGSKSIELIENQNQSDSDHPDYRLLQSSELRSRFGSFIDPELYAMPTGVEKKDSLISDSLKTGNLQKCKQKSLNKNEKLTNDDKSKKKRKKKVTKQTHTRSDKQNDDILEELPNSMDDLYKYIRMKQLQDSIQRKENSRKDKVEPNVYELEQQQRKLKELQN